MTGGEFGILGNYAQFFLSGKGDLTLAIPTVSELASILVDPLLRDVVGGVGCAGGEVGKERLIGGEGFLLTNPSDRSIGQILGQVIAFLRGFRRFDRGCSLVQCRLPLVIFATDKAVEILESTPAGGPSVKGTDRAGLPNWYFVAFTELRRGIAVQLQG